MELEASPRHGYTVPLATGNILLTKWGPCHRVAYQVGCFTALRHAFSVRLTQHFTATAIGIALGRNSDSRYLEILLRMLTRPAGPWIVFALVFLDTLSAMF